MSCQKFSDGVSLKQNIYFVVRCRGTDIEYLWKRYSQPGFCNYSQIIFKGKLIRKRCITRILTTSRRARREGGGMFQLYKSRVKFTVKGKCSKSILTLEMYGHEEHLFSRVWRRPTHYLSLHTSLYCKSLKHR